MDSIGKMQTGLGLSLANALTFGFFALKDSSLVLGYVTFGLIYLAIGFGWRLESLVHEKRVVAKLENAHYDQGTALLWAILALGFSIVMAMTNPLANLRFNLWFILPAIGGLACLGKCIQVFSREN